MPKLSRELTTFEVGRLRTEGVHAVGYVPSLYLQIIGGSRSGVPLTQARNKAHAARMAVEQGACPIQARLAHMDQTKAASSRALTFTKACEKFIAAREAEWRNSKYLQQWKNSLTTYAGPIMGKKEVSDIQQCDGACGSAPIWNAFGRHGGGLHLATAQAQGVDVLDVVTGARASARMGAAPCAEPCLTASTVVLLKDK